MDLTVSNYRTHQPAFQQGFFNPSATRACKHALQERLTKVAGEAIEGKVPYGTKMYEDIMNEHDLAVTKLQKFVNELPDSVSICSGEGTDAVFKFVHEDPIIGVTSLPTTDIFEKASVPDAFEAIQYVANKLTSEFKPNDVVNLLLTKMVKEPRIVNGRPVGTLRPRSAVLDSAKKFAQETGNMKTYNSLEQEALEHEPLFEQEYRALQELLA